MRYIIGISSNSASKQPIGTDVRPGRGQRVYPYPRVYPIRTRTRGLGTGTDFVLFEDPANYHNEIDTYITFQVFLYTVVFLCSLFRMSFGNRLSICYVTIIRNFIIQPLSFSQCSNV